VATTADAATVARLLDAFNREFDTATPGPVVLAKRLERLLAGDGTIALLAGDPAVAVAVLTLRTNVWYEGPVALLDELYVVPELRGQGVGSALLAAAESVTGRVAVNCSRSTSTARTPMPAGSMRGTATSTASRGRTSRCSTTTEN